MVLIKHYASSFAKSLRCCSCIRAKMMEGRAEEEHINEFLGEVLAEIEYTQDALIDDAIRDQDDLLELQQHLLTFWHSCNGHGSEWVCLGCQAIR